MISILKSGSTKVLGYMLLELVLVLLMIAILSSLLFPDFFKLLQNQQQTLKQGNVMPVIIHGHHLEGKSPQNHLAIESTDRFLSTQNPTTFLSHSPNNGSASLLTGVANSRTDEMGAALQDPLENLNLEQQQLVKQTLKGITKTDQSMQQTQELIQNITNEP